MAKTDWVDGQSVPAAQLNALGVDVNSRELAANRGAANGYTPLGSDVKVPAQYLPSYVDDIIEGTNLAAFPGTGESGKVYVALDTNKTYRWSGSGYVVVSETLAIGTGPGTAAAGNDARLSDRRVPIDGSVNFYGLDPALQAAVTQSARTGVFTFEHPNALLAVGAYAISTRSLFSIPHETANAGFRFHFRNYNFAGDVGASNNMTAFTAFVAEAAVGADGEPNGQYVPGTRVQIQTSATLVGGAWLTTNWIPLATLQLKPHKQYMLGMSINCPSGGTLSSGGGAHWYTTTPSDAGVDAPAGLTRVENQGMLDKYMEYHFIDDGAPIIVSVSNSISNGGNTGGNTAAAANQAELGSWGNLWAKRNRGVFANLGFGGGWAGHFTASTPKWDLFANLAVPLDVDAVIFYALTSSDMTAGTPRATVLSALGIAIAKARAMWPNAIIIITNNPARAETTAGALETERLALNRILANRPHRSSICLDVDSPVTDWASPARLRPVFRGDEANDGTHWSGRAHENAADQLVSAVPRRVQRE